MNEKILNQLIASAIRSGDTSFELSDEIIDRILEQPGAELSDALKTRVKLKVKVRVQDAAIRVARRRLVPHGTMPLGRFIENLREQAQLTRMAVGERLRKTDDFVERLERGHINPLQLAIQDFADVAELFQLQISTLPAMISASLGTAGAKHNYRAIARSHGGLKHNQRGEDVERALEAFARTVPRKANAATNAPDEINTCLNKLKAELERRGRTDLLT